MALFFHLYHTNHTLGEREPRMLNMSPLFLQIMGIKTTQNYKSRLEPLRLTQNWSNSSDLLSERGYAVVFHVYNTNQTGSFPCILHKSNPWKTGTTKVYKNTPSSTSNNACYKQKKPKFARKH